MDPERQTAWRYGLILTAVVFTALVLNNSHVIFQTPIYETGDIAANSLQVQKAKHFRETLGNYSRFGFHHPGPAFFYVFAAGEALFFDAAHAVPTAFNGQLIAHYLLSAFFFAVSLALIGGWLDRGAARWFLGLALLFAAWHFGAVGKFYEFIPARLGLLNLWSPCLIVLPFLCFVVVAASVSAGSGKDLWLMVLAGCFLVHGHVAMPLFVVPVASLAYACLWMEARRTGRRPCNLFPRQHWIAGAIIALFLVPIAIDCFTTHPSNLQRIVGHFRGRYGEGKGILQSLFYFLHFATYAAYASHPSHPPIPVFEPFDSTRLLAFFSAHWRACALWFGSILLFAMASKSAAPPNSQRRQIQKFRRRLCLILVVAAVLSLFWGMLQEGPMFDFNALFNFAIFYGWLLVVALSVAVWIEDQLVRAGKAAARIRLAGLIAVSLAVIIAFGHERRRFRASPDEKAERAFADAIERALILDRIEPKFLNFDWQAGGEATRVALYLERHGIQWWVREDWPLFFGEERILRQGKAGQPVATSESSFWRIGLRANTPGLTAANANAFRLTDEYDLIVNAGKSPPAP